MTVNSPSVTVSDSLPQTCPSPSIPSPPTIVVPFSDPATNMTQLVTEAASSTSSSTSPSSLSPIAASSTQEQVMDLCE
jgi:hypothetical protein